jgi:bifunctional N-acetylglucosamine-1-phosphate-uridyltransferase/glucosamine-1-phosphate-acetyltransferase GlmU-like protein
MNQLGVILLAAGQGTRMKSAVPKVLHSLGGKALFLHVLENARRLDPAIIAIVVGHAARRVQDACPARDINWAIQEEQLGTGHAVLCAQDKFHEFAGDILILSGDVPLIQEQTLRAMIENQRSSRADLSFLTAQLDNPNGYGRILRDAGGAVTGHHRRKRMQPTSSDRSPKSIPEFMWSRVRSFLTHWPQLRIIISRRSIT